MKKQTKLVVGVLIIVAVAVGMYFGINSLSTIETQPSAAQELSKDTFWDATCSDPTDCEQWFVDQGLLTAEEVEQAKSDIRFLCVDGECVTRDR